MTMMFQSHKTDFAEVQTFTVPFLGDRRGGFVKLFSQLSRALVGDFHVKEIFTTHSTANVLRGLHFQAPPKDQSKYVVVVEGLVHEVLLDIRSGSSSYGQTYETLLESPRAETASHPSGVFVPSGFAHGYVVLSDTATVLYVANHDFDPELDGGVAWNSVSCKWPVQDPILSDKDLQLPKLADFRTPFVMTDRG